MKYPQRVALTAAEKIQAECEDRSSIYLLTRADETGSVVTCDQCPCVVTPERFDEAAAAVAELEAGDPTLKGSIYLASWSDDGAFSIRRIGAVQ